MHSLPVVLSIAGSDNSAGAGIQADLKTFSALRTYGTTAVTCVVAEVPGKVSAIHPIPADNIAEQIRLIFAAFPVAAVKTGMLHSREIIQQVVATLADCFAKTATPPPLVVDPVMIATSGHPLLQPDAIGAYIDQLFSLATIITPNLDEAAHLLGRPISDRTQIRPAAEELAARYHTSVLVKGGHLPDPIATDLLATQGQVHEFSAPYVSGVSTHGTGCTYSAAIAAHLALGFRLPEAVANAKNYLTATIKNYLRWHAEDAPTDALHHFSPRPDNR